MVNLHISVRFLLIKNLPIISPTLSSSRVPQKIENCHYFLYTFSPRNIYFFLIFPPVYRPHHLTCFCLRKRKERGGKDGGILINSSASASAGWMEIEWVRCKKGSRLVPSWFGLLASKKESKGLMIKCLPKQILISGSERNASSIKTSSKSRWCFVRWCWMESMWSCFWCKKMLYYLWVAAVASSFVGLIWGNLQVRGLGMLQGR